MASRSLKSRNPDARASEHRIAEYFVCFVFIFPPSITKPAKNCYIYVEGNIHKQKRCVMLYYRHYHFRFFFHHQVPMHIAKSIFPRLHLPGFAVVRPARALLAGERKQFRLFGGF